MEYKDMFLTSFDIRRLVNENGRVTNARLGASTNYFAALERGYAVFSFSGKRFELYPGELLYIPQGLPYVSEWYGEGFCSFYSLAFTFRYFSENSAYNLQKLSECDFDFESVLKGIYELRDGSCAQSLSLFYSLYSFAESKLEKRELSFNHSRISKAVDYMENHFAEDFDVPALSKMCGMSESGFYTEFKKITGYTPIRYKNILKCRRAVELLQNSDYGVETVADKVGCTDASYLRRVLFKELGKTPKQIRAEKQLI